MAWRAARSDRHLSDELCREFSHSRNLALVLYRLRALALTLEALYVEQEPASAPVAASSQPHPAGPAQSADEIEGEVFAQAAAIDRLLALMHTLRARGEDFADNEELTVRRPSS